MDIKKKIEEIVAKIQNDKTFAARFKSDPVKTVESLLGVDLPDDQIKKVIEGVKAKISMDQVGGVLNKVKGFFKK